MLRPLRIVSRLWRDSSPRKVKMLTTDIHLVFRGLKFEPNTGIEQKGAFVKGLIFGIA
jgi:hypothetical protein